jgi:uncharacterized protein (TIGR02118 family)
MSKIIFVIFKKPDITHEKCIAEWRGERHVAVVSKVKGLNKWVLNDVQSTPNDNTPDGIGELWFENDDIRAEAMRSPEMAAATEDAKNFLDMDKTYAVMVDETELIR